MMTNSRILWAETMDDNDVFVFGKFPSLNEFLAATNNNRYDGANMKKQVERDIMLQIGRLRRFENPIIITFIWHEETKRRDKDNVAFAKKFFLDALQKAGKLPNDNNRYIEGFNDRFIYYKGQGVRLIIEELQGGSFNADH